MCSKKHAVIKRIEGDMALQYNDDTFLMQQIMIDNLDKLGFSNISGHTIGNYGTGEPDGLLGNGTSTALHTLMIMSQHAAGVDPNEMNTSYNTDSIGYVKDYMINSGIPEATVNSFISKAETLYPNGTNNHDFDEAELNTDNMAAELNVAELRRLGEGGVVLGAPVSETTVTNAPVIDADGTVHANGHVAALQAVLINNLDALQLEGITAQTIGNAAGEPDDLLGNGTSTALQQLAIKAQASIGGVASADTTIEYNAETIANIKDYMLAANVPEDAVNSFVNEAQLLSTDFRGAYVTAATVDASGLTIPDLSAVAEIESTDLTDNISSAGNSESIDAPTDDPGYTLMPAGLGYTSLTEEGPGYSLMPAPLTPTQSDDLGYTPLNLDIYDPTANLQNSRDITPVYGPSLQGIGAAFQAANEQTGVSLETQANTNGTVVMMTQGDYDALKDGRFLTDLEKAQVEAFPGALEAATQASGLAEAQANYEAAMNRNVGTENYALRTEARGVMTEMNELRESLMDTPLTFNITDNGVEKEVTYTMREVDQMESDSWWDNSEEQANFDAGGAAYRELLDQNGYQELQENYQDLNNRASNGSVFREIRDEQIEAREALQQVRENLETNQIAVTIPDQSADPAVTNQLAMTGTP